MRLIWEVSRDNVFCLLVPCLVGLFTSIAFGVSLKRQRRAIIPVHSTTSIRIVSRAWKIMAAISPAGFAPREHRRAFYLQPSAFSVFFYLPKKPKQYFNAHRLSLQQAQFAGGRAYSQLWARTCSSSLISVDARTS